MIVKLPSNGYVNLTNLTDAHVERNEFGEVAIDLYWNYAMERGRPAYHRYTDADAQAIIDALDALAEAARRRLQ